VKGARETQEPRRVLVVGPAWIGDMVMAQSLFKTLKRDHPNASIDVLAPAWSAPLLKRMPEVHEAIVVPLAHGQPGLRARYRWGRRLAPRAYDRAIILPRSLKAALIPWFARVPRRTGYLGEWRYGLINDLRPLDRGLMPRMVQRYVALGLEPDAASPAGIPEPALTTNAGNAARLMAALELSLSPPAVGLMPGAEYGPAKQWPLDYYAALARQLDADGLQVWVFGSQKDHAAAEVIIAQAGCGINLCGKLQLEDAIDLIAQLSVAVSNDSGLMHVTAAVGVPLVAIFGSSTPEYTPPLTRRASIMYAKVACSPCFERTCRYGHYHCLRDISVTRLVAEIRAHRAADAKPCKAGISF
jgi:heptosyltransferase II